MMLSFWNKVKHTFNSTIEAFSLQIIHFTRKPLNNNFHDVSLDPEKYMFSINLSITETVYTSGKLLRVTSEKGCIKIP